MKILLKSAVLLLPIIFIYMFFLLLIEEKPYPGADYKEFSIPSFNLETLYESDLMTDADMEGDYIINIWASWCITCRVEHPYLMSLKNKRIPVVGINYKDKRNEAIDWLARFGNPYEIIIYDFKGSLALDLGVTGAPETFLVNNGNIVAHYQGEINEAIWKDVFVPIINEKEMFR